MKKSPKRRRKKETVGKTKPKRKRRVREEKDIDLCAQCGAPLPLRRKKRKFQMRFCKPECGIIYHKEKAVKRIMAEEDGYCELHDMTFAELKKPPTSLTCATCMMFVEFQCAYRKTGADIPKKKVHAGEVKKQRILAPETKDLIFNLIRMHEIQQDEFTFQDRMDGVEGAKGWYIMPQDLSRMTGRPLDVIYDYLQGLHIEGKLFYEGMFVESRIHMEKRFTDYKGRLTTKSKNRIGMLCGGAKSRYITGSTEERHIIRSR